MKDAHARNLKLKIYYTLRELSSYVTEFWAVRSLGNEIFYPGPGFQTVAAPPDAKPAGPVLVNNDRNKPGAKAPWEDLPRTGSAWLAEHAITDYSPAWHMPMGNGRYDAAVNLRSQTRWENYYLEGLAWLLKNVGIDGIYLDDLVYDHETMKRVRKVLDRTRPGCLIDLHSNNWQGIYKKSPATFYIEHMPMVDSLWFGELFDYDHKPPDYWLVEISGIPYGLFGEMLEGGGNLWRGMIYGMANRFGAGNPGPMWKAWDDFGIQDARMIGYWDPACPVRTDNKDVLATVYVKRGKTLVSLASWAPQAVKCRLKIDWKALGLDPAKAKLSAEKHRELPARRRVRPQRRHPRATQAWLAPRAARMTELPGRTGHGAMPTLAWESIEHTLAPLRKGASKARKFLCPSFGPIAARQGFGYAVGMSDAPRPRLRWFQYRLRTLFIVMLLASIGMSWVATRMQKAKRQRAAIEIIEKRGEGHVLYDYQFDSSGNVSPNARPPWPAWLRKLLGDDFFITPVRAAVAKDAGLEGTGVLTQLQEVQVLGALFGGFFTDRGMEHLREAATTQEVDGQPRLQQDFRRWAEET